MAMFNNGGNGTVDFDASYMEEVTRIKSQQRGAETTNGVYVSVSLNEDVRPICSFNPLRPPLIQYRYSASGRSLDFPSSSVWIPISQSLSVRGTRSMT